MGDQDEQHDLPLAWLHFINGNLRLDEKGDLQGLSQLQSPVTENQVSNAETFLKELRQSYIDRQGEEATVDFEKIIISYATGHRISSQEGCRGPGILIAAYTIATLYLNHNPCYSDIFTLGGDPWKREFDRRIYGGSVKVMVALLTEGFFQSINCMEEVALAKEHHIPIIPFRVENTTKNTHDMWPDEAIERSLAKHFERSTDPPAIERGRELYHKQHQAREAMKKAHLPSYGSLLDNHERATNALLARLRKHLAVKPRLEAAGSVQSWSACWVSLHPSRRSARRKLIIALLVFFLIGGTVVVALSIVLTRKVSHVPKEDAPIQESLESPPPVSGMMPSAAPSATESDPTVTPVSKKPVNIAPLLVQQPIVELPMTPPPTPAQLAPPPTHPPTLPPTPPPIQSTTQQPAPDPTLSPTQSTPVPTLRQRTLPPSEQPVLKRRFVEYVVEWEVGLNGSADLASFENQLRVGCSENGEIQIVSESSDISCGKPDCLNRGSVVDCSPLDAPIFPTFFVSSPLYWEFSSAIIDFSIRFRCFGSNDAQLAGFSEIGTQLVNFEGSFLGNDEIIQHVAFAAVLSDNSVRDDSDCSASLFTVAGANLCASYGECQETPCAIFLESRRKAQNTPVPGIFIREE